MKKKHNINIMLLIIIGVLLCNIYMKVINPNRTSTSSITIPLVESTMSNARKSTKLSQKTTSTPDKSTINKKADVTRQEKETKPIIERKEKVTQSTAKIQSTKFQIAKSNKKNKKQKKYIGTFKITAYNPYSDGGKWGYQTATGVKSSHLKTCAVDPCVIPLGSTLYIDGIGSLKAVDTGNKVKGKVIDIFYDGSEKSTNKWINSFGSKHKIYIIK